MSDTIMYWNGFISAGVTAILIFWWYKQYFQAEKIPFCAQEIVSNLWLGSFEDSLQLSELKKRKITRILSITFGNYPVHEEDFDYLFVRCMDEDNQHISSYFEETNAFIDEARKAGEGVFVHCMQGVSRSSSFVIAYLLTKQFRKDELLGGELAERITDSETNEGEEELLNFEVEEALQLVRSKRGRVNPNAGFMHQLQEFHAERDRKRDTSKDSDEKDPEENDAVEMRGEGQSKREWKAEMYRFSKTTQELVCVNPHELQDFSEKLRALAYHTFLRFYNFHFRRFHRYLKDKTHKCEQLEDASQVRRRGRRYPFSDQDYESEEGSLFFSK